MARPLRLEFAGALYHVTSRGDRREDIYLNDGDREMFLLLFNEVCLRFNWICHAYCLMGNHYHLVIETRESNLSKGMRHLNGVYTQKFNSSHSRVGHVFQGRYKAILVEKEAHLLELTRYVVLNPVRARMVVEPADWPWSSYLATVGVVESPDCLDTEWLLTQFGDRKREAVLRYIEFVFSGISETVTPWVDLKDQIYLGSDDFIEKMKNLVCEDKALDEVPACQRRQLPKSLDFYKESSISKKDAIAKAFKSGGYTMKEIACYFGVHYSTVSRVVRRSDE